MLSDVSANQGPARKWRRNPTRNPRHMVMDKMRKEMGKYSGGPLTLLGIESSWDRTGVAVVDESGCVLGEAVHVQTRDGQM